MEVEMTRDCVFRSAFFTKAASFASLFIILASNVAFTQTNPIPLINQPLVPDVAAPSGFAFVLTVSGTGFVSGSTVNWNGSPRATSFVSDSKLTATITAADIASARTAAVTVVNPKPGGGTSNAVFLEVTSAGRSLAFNTSDFGAGLSPSSIAIGDFNSDGTLDLAVANAGDNNVRILLGNGDGTFQNGANYTVGSTPLGIAAGDFNGDGKLDLAVPNAGSDDVSVLLGNGDGTFQPAVNYAVGSYPRSVAVGDFNSDGMLDLAVANTGTDSTLVSILLGNGDGTFQATVNYPAGPQPESLAVGDFNGDGKLDLSVTNLNGQNVSVLLGNGDGSFQGPVNYEVGLGPNYVEAADLNGDGNLDLVVCNYYSNNISVLLGKGDGTFRTAVNFGDVLGPSSPALGDFNGDGRLDLAVGNYNSNIVSVFLGNGDGTFRSSANYGAGASPNWVAAGDFNGDGRLDLAVANYGGTTVSVLSQGTTAALSTASLNFGDHALRTRSTPQQVILANTGGISLVVGSVTISGTNAADFGEINTCDSTVPPRGMCSIRIVFAPSAKGTRTATLTITDNAGGSPQSIALTGTGTVVALSPATLSFGDQAVGTKSQPQSITVTNVGSDSVHFIGIALAGENFTDFVFQSSCGANLPAGASCTIGVIFAPKAEGDRNSTLTVGDDGGGSPQKVSLAGIGT
jgi:hypothetical protein